MIDCTICLEGLKTPVATPCGHIFCEECLGSHIDHVGTVKIWCPTCRVEFFRDSAFSKGQSLLCKNVVPTVRRLYIGSAAAENGRGDEFDHRDECRQSTSGERQTSADRYASLEQSHRVLQARYELLEQHLDSPETVDDFLSKEAALETEIQDLKRDRRTLQSQLEAETLRASHAQKHATELIEVLDKALSLSYDYRSQSASNFVHLRSLTSILSRLVDVLDFATARSVDAPGGMRREDRGGLVPGRGLGRVPEDPMERLVSIMIWSSLVLVVFLVLTAFATVVVWVVPYFSAVLSYAL